MSFVLPGNPRSLRFTGEIKAVDSKKDGPPPVLGKPRERKITTPAPAPSPISSAPPPASMPMSMPMSAQPRSHTPMPPAVTARAHNTPMPNSSPPVSRQPASMTQPPQARSFQAQVQAIKANLPAQSMRGGGAASMRGGRQQDEDDGPTTAMDRDGLDVLPGGNLMRSTRPPPQPLQGSMHGSQHSSQNAHAAQAMPQHPPIPHFRPRNMGQVPTFNTNHQEQPQGFTMPLPLWLVASVLIGILSYHVAPQVFVSRPPMHQQ